MGYTNRFFSGDFNKKHRYISKKMMERYGIAALFKSELLLRAEEDIFSVIGKKRVYSATDAALFFQKKYNAYRIPWEYVMQYYDSSIIRIEYYVPATLGDDEIRPFNYNTSGEKAIVLVFDTTLNPQLKTRFPRIKEYEDELYNRSLNLRKNEIIFLHPNPILIIGTFDCKKVNSMFITNNMTIEDIEYEAEFFRTHT
ncbi:MAG: hypothetical protein LBQ40_00075 [Clostridiales bacterium]|nr:hypothetical protein [Clostridiales bacterium]